MQFQRLLSIDWDVIAGVIAALLAIILSFLGMASEIVIRGIILLLLAILLIRDLRAEARVRHLESAVDLIRQHGFELAHAIARPDILLFGPRRLRQAFRQFAVQAQGDVVWHNVCCRMFHRQPIFDATLRVMMANPDIRSIQLLCNDAERPHWDEVVLPKVRGCPEADKVRPPRFGPLPAAVSFVMADIDNEGHTEALVSVQEEPFAAHNLQPSVPRYVMRVQAGSDLIGALTELARHSASNFSEADAIAPARGG